MTQWNVNFKTEGCSKSPDHHLRKHRINEVEIAKSIGELMTSRSIVVCTDFPDYDMLDAMIASALKKPSGHAQKSKCRRAACSKIRPVLTKSDKIAYMKNEHFRVAE